MNARPLPFFGINKQFLGISGLVLGLPVVLASANVLAAPTAAMLAASLALALCTLLSVWAAFDGVHAHLRTATVVLLAVGSAGLGAWAVASALFPGPPLARAVLPRAGATQALDGVSAPDTYLLAVRATLPPSESARGRYQLEMRSGTQRFELANVLQRRMGPLGPGRLRPPAPPPAEWSRHEGWLGASPVTATLTKSEPALEEGVEVWVYARTPAPWMFWVAGALALLIALVASRYEQPLRRQFVVTPALMAASFALLAASWSWVGDPLRPVLGAGAVVLIPAWLAAKLLDAVARRLPFAAKAPPR